MQTEDLVIVGAGPAGVAAAVQCKRLGFSPLLLEATGRAGGLAENAFFIENYPCVKPADGAAFASGLRRHLKRFGIVPQTAKVEQISHIEDTWHLETEQGDLRARGVIVATGTVPKTLDISGAAELEHQGLFYEVRQVLPFLDSKTAGVDGPRWNAGARGDGVSHRDDCVIIGGGEASLDYALSLARTKRRTAIYVRGNRLRSRGRLVEIVKRTGSIRLVFGHQARRISRSERGIAVEFQTPRGLVVEVAPVVLAAIGRRQTLVKLLKGLDVHPVRTVSTRFPGLYIAGDARHGSLGQIGMAVGDGLAASMAAAAWLEKF